MKIASGKARKIALAAGISALGAVGVVMALSGGFGLRQIVESIVVRAASHLSRPIAHLTAAVPATAGGDASIAIPRTMSHDSRVDLMTTRNATGWLRTVNREGFIDTSNPFFQELGTNGRTCNTCHQQAAAWSMTPTEIQQRFASTAGTDPLFRTNDGSNSPFADVSTVAARRAAYSMLLGRGVIRVGIPVPANAEFELVAVDDPYHFASAAELSLFRRPLPSTNLTYITGIMWDGRETITPFLPPMHAGQDNAALLGALFHQANSATKGHAEGLDPTAQEADDIVAFETGLTTAQIRDDMSGFLNQDDAIGGPRVLANQRFHVGINDTLGADPTGAAFDFKAMNLFEAWDNPRPHGARERERASIARGERLFNEKPLTITDVAGLNDALQTPSIPGTCTTCHNAPNVGNHTVALPLNIGLADASRRTPDMPLYTLRNKTTNQTVQTTDPGLALITGKWNDVGKFKGPVLRALAARPPYFHNGFAASLKEVVDFYDTRFDMQLTPTEKRDLAAFLRAL